MASALRGDSHNGNKGMEAFDTMAGGSEGIFFHLALDARAIDDGFDVVFAQAGEEALDGGFGAAPLRGIVFSEEMEGAHINSGLVGLRVYAGPRYESGNIEHPTSNAEH